MSGLASKTSLLVINVLALSLVGVAAFGSKPVTTSVKHDYTIEIQKVVVDKMSKEYLHEDSYVMTSLNQDSRMTLRASATLLKDAPPNGTVTIIASMLDPITNKFNEKFRMSETYCGFIENNTYFAKNIYKDTNLPRKCPIPAGEYYINGIVVDNTEFPKHMAESEWRGDIILLSTTAEDPMLTASVYANVEPLDED